MSAETGRGVFDPDLDVGRSGHARQAVAPIGECQRLVANPALMVLCWGASFLVARHGLQMQSLPVFLAGLALLPLSPCAVQYHCLDCGATGWIIRSRRHACPAVVKRQHSRGTWRRRGPAVATQITLWLYTLLACFLLFLIGYLAR